MGVRGCTVMVLCNFGCHNKHVSYVTHVRDMTPSRYWWADHETLTDETIARRGP